MITAGQLFTVDAGTGCRVAGRYDLEMLDHNRLAVFLSPHDEPARLLCGAANSEQRLPLAIVLGGDPRTLLAVAAPLPPGTDPAATGGRVAGKAAGDGQVPQHRVGSAGRRRDRPGRLHRPAGSAGQGRPALHSLGPIGAGPAGAGDARDDHHPPGQSGLPGHGVRASAPRRGADPARDVAGAAAAVEVVDRGTRRLGPADVRRGPALGHCVDP